jgi:hypothetical protein
VTGERGDTMEHEGREVALLLECAARAVEPYSTRTPATRLCEGIDWLHLLELTRAHGVTPLLHRSLPLACPDAVPEGILDELENRFYANAGRNLFLAQQLLEILHLFDSRGIAAIPYKGPAFCAAAYGDLISREFGDLDILLHERDYAEAQRVLLAHGYRMAARFDWESTFVHDSGACAVDLHRRITPLGFRCPLDFEHLSQRLEPVELCGRTIRTLCAEDALLMVAIQITKDAGTDYFQLGKVCDLARLIRTNPELLPAPVLLDARKLGAERMVLFVMRLAHDLLGTPLSHEFTDRLRAHPGIDRLVAHARRALFPSDAVESGSLTPETFHWAIRERLSDRLYPYYYRYVVQPMQPSELDREFLRLPAGLSFLYYALRPIRLMGKYVFRRSS